jgi:hypothetical protein
MAKTINWRNSVLFRWAACALILMSLNVPAAAAQESSCRKHPRVVAACFRVHGRLSNWNGNPTRRIWIVGTKRMLGLRDGTTLPPELEGALADFDHEVYGDFEFCPFTAAKPGVMQVGCVEEVSNYRVEKRE